MKNKTLFGGLFPLLLLGLILRYSLMIFNHPWDIRTFYNLFIELGKGTDPYLTMRDFTYLIRSHATFGWSNWYEYYAYPPLLIYIYFPLAKLLLLVHPDLKLMFALPGSSGIPPQVFRYPLAFLFLFKTPIFLADLGTAILILKMGDRKAFKRFYFNPFVIFISAMWMIESIATFFLVLAVHLIEREHHYLSAVSLSLGFLAKFFPLFALPTICLHYIRRRSFHFLSYILIFVAFSVLLIYPYWHGFLFALKFMGARSGGGLTLHSLINVYLQFSSKSVIWLQTMLSPEIGKVTLLGGLGLIYVYIFRKKLPLRTNILLTYLAFYLSTKLVNEQYVFWIIPFLVLELSFKYTQTRMILTKLLYSLPLAFAILNVPLHFFMYPLSFNRESLEFLRHLQLPLKQQSIFLFLVALAFTATLIFSLIKFSHHEKED